MKKRSEDYYIHPNAIVETHSIGKGSRIWAFAHILPNAQIGEDCNICDYVFVENDVVIGNRVTIKCGVQLWDGITLEDDTFVGPNATFTNDRFPRSKQYPEKFAKTLIRKGASIGANATVLPGLTVGVNAMIGAGAVVTKNVPPNAIVVGNPANIVGYVETPQHSSEQLVSLPSEQKLSKLSVKDAALYKMPLIEDLRGALSFGDFKYHFPFIPKRYFLVFDVPNKEIRGEHAHKTLQEFLVCVKGKCAVTLDDGQLREEVELSSPTIGLFVPAMLWRTHYKYTPDAMLLVFASDIYRPDDYIRNYDEFLSLLSQEDKP